MKLLDFAKHFDSEEACEKYLKKTREKEGIKCSRCGCEKQYWNRCHKLESINIPEGVTTLGYEAFERCLQLKSVTLPSSITNIAPDAFKD
ncbi:MAG: leucine-rich repeat protein, partial [Bacteroidaceae bacterium]|nr:leucine-rich repeat protein [Bacteroidaceae bacterium]